MSTPKHPKRPRDPNQFAKLIVDLATGEATDPAATEPAPDPDPTPETPKPEKDPAAVSHGRRGGLKGGKARAASLTPEKRAEIARKAAAARWKKA
jgi:hypothetical protein